MNSTVTLMICFNSEKIVDEFLNVVDRKFEVTDLVKVQLVFSIINYQPPENEFFVDIIDQRTWLTDVYSCKFLNKFVKSGLKRDILKRITVNVLTGSSWRFKRFNKISSDA